MGNRMQHSRWTVLTLLCTLTVTAHARSCARADVLVKGKPAIPDECSELHLRKSKPTFQELEKLCASIRGHKKLVRIDLSWNEIKDEGLEEIVAALKDNSLVHGVAMELNEFTDVGAEHIADLLEGNTVLTQLFIGANKIESQASTRLLQ